MHRTSLIAILALSLAGCGFDGEPTAPQDPGAIADPGFGTPEPQLTVTPTNGWAATGQLRGLVDDVGRHLIRSAEQWSNASASSPNRSATSAT